MIDPNKAELEIKIKDGLFLVQKDEKKGKLIDYIVDHCGKKLARGKVVQLTNNGYSFNAISEGEYYLFVKLFADWSNTNLQKDGTKYFDVDLTDYFTTSERESANNIIPINNESSILKIKVLSKGTEDNPEWIGIMSYEEIVVNDGLGLIKYNLNTQRIANVYVRDGKSYRIAEIDENEINEIAKSIENGTFHSNTITLNILRTGTEKYINPSTDENILIINANEQEVDIIDGMHRVKGIVKAWSKRAAQIKNGEKVNQISGTMAVCIKNLNEKQAKQFIHQESLANQQRNIVKSYYAPNSSLNKFFSKINKEDVYTEDGKPILTGRFSLLPSADNGLSVAFILQFLERFRITSKFKFMEDNLKRNNGAEDFCEFIEILFSELQKDKEFWKKNEEILLSFCFIAGCFLLFFDKCVKVNPPKVSQLSKEEIYSFSQKVLKTNKTDWLFDFPFPTGEMKRIREMYSI